jgi:hypothetical protein
MVTVKGCIYARDADPGWLGRIHGDNGGGPIPTNRRIEERAVASECHAIEIVNSEFDTTCRLMTTHGAAILDSASRSTAIQFRQDAPPDSPGIGRLVASPLVVDRDGWATSCMHWLADEGEQGQPSLSAWMRGELHLLRGRGSHAPVTELLLTVRCDIGPSGRFHDDPHIRGLVDGFLAEVARSIQEHAAKGVVVG